MTRSTAKVSLNGKVETFSKDLTSMINVTAMVNSITQMVQFIKENGS